MIILLCNHCQFSISYFSLYSWLDTDFILQFDSLLYRYNDGIKWKTTRGIPFLRTFFKERDQICVLFVTHCKTNLNKTGYKNILFHSLISCLPRFLPFIILRCTDAYRCQELLTIRCLFY